MKDFHEMKIAELKDFARFNGLKSAYKFRKKELWNWMEERERQGLLRYPEDAEGEESSSVQEEKMEEGETISAQERKAEEGEQSSTQQEKTEEREPSSAQERKAEEGEQGSAQEEKIEDAVPSRNAETAVPSLASGEEHLKRESAREATESLPTTIGVLEVMPDGYGFLRTGSEQDHDQKDYYMPAAHIKRFSLRSGDIVEGLVGDNKDENKYAPIIFLKSVNGTSPHSFRKRTEFDDLTPIYANQRLRLERGEKDISNRIIDLVAPIGRGQRGLIVSPPKAGKTTLLKSIAHAIEEKYPEIYLFILLIDERPEEVTDFERSVNRTRKEDDPLRTEVIASTFDRPAQNHTKTAEMLLDRAKRLVESGQDVVILLDSLTRLSRAYNITTNPSGRTLSGGLDPVALYPPKRFFGSARNIDGEGSLTILATCLTDTGSRMDDMIYEEFKGTGNMEVHLSRALSELRIFPAIDIFSSGTRRDDLLLNEEEQQAMIEVRRAGRGEDQADNMAQFVQLIRNTRSNQEFCQLILANARNSVRR